jgi:membrane fusion protein, copper/silver efflux system
MRKLIYIVVVAMLMAGSFLAGSLYFRQSGTKIKANDTRQTPKENSSEPQEDLSSMPPGTLKINPEKQQMIGIRAGQVEKKAVIHTMRLLGRVAADETRIYVINATVDGWITKTLPNSTGSLVKKNEVLAAFYSPEFLSAVQALLYALGSMDRVKTTGRESPAQKDQIAQFKVNLQQYKDSLKNLGMGDLQIEKMIQTRQWMENVDITSPADGFILIRNVSDGLRFVKGSEMYRIADLSRVWVLADVYEREVRYFKPGVKATVLLPYQDRTYQATVSKVLPVFDATTRTLKVRFEVDNPGFVMRPDMFVDVELPIKLPPAITIPSDAILDSGLKKTVFVDRGNGFFEPREVETGWRIGNRVEILKGLEVGEKIVTSGTFLIDSESKLELAAQGMYTTLSKDPVCGVDVAMRKADKAGLKASHRGKTYYFDSEECKQKFEREPERYVKKE